MDELNRVIQIARQAGQEILRYQQHPESLQVRYKTDKTVLTAADLAAHRIIAETLSTTFPDIPLLSEEGEVADYEKRQHWSRYWLVDPLDGTRGFVEGSDEFTVNIALIENGVAVLGVIDAPALGVCYYATQALGAFRQSKDDHTAVAIIVRSLDWSSYGVTVGRHSPTRQKPIAACVRDEACELAQHNSSLKLCLLAEGSVDIYPNFGRTSEWDTAAGQCILEQAGGVLLDYQQQPLRYNDKPGLTNPPFVAIGDASQVQQVLDLITNQRRTS